MRRPAQLWHWATGRLSMDWRILASTFTLVFLAELGDKTQLTTLTLATKSGAQLSVLLGALLALALSTIFSVVLSVGLCRVIPAAYINRVAGLIFIIIGIIILLNK